MEIDNVTQADAGGTTVESSIAAATNVMEQFCFNAGQNERISFVGVLEC